MKLSTSSLHQLSNTQFFHPRSPSLCAESPHIVVCHHGVISIACHNESEEIRQNSHKEFQQLQFQGHHVALNRSSIITLVFLSDFFYCSIKMIKYFSKLFKSSNFFGKHCQWIYFSVSLCFSKTYYKKSKTLPKLMVVLPSLCLFFIFSLGWKLHFLPQLQ